MYDKAVEACIADEKIAAATEDEERQIALSGEGNGLEKFGFGFDLAEEARWATNAEGGVGGERNLLLKLQLRWWHGLRVQHQRPAMFDTPDRL